MQEGEKQFRRIYSTVIKLINVVCTFDSVRMTNIPKCITATGFNFIQYNSTKHTNPTTYCRKRIRLFFPVHHLKIYEIVHFEMLQQLLAKKKTHPTTVCRAVCGLLAELKASEGEGRMKSFVTQCATKWQEKAAQM